MANKYFAWSFDDGLQQDVRIVSILRKYGMGATFHLNSGLFGDRTYEGRIGNLGMKEVPADTFHTRRHFLPYTEHFRLREEEAVQLYDGFEIASHTRTHANLKNCGAEKARSEIMDDVQALSRIFRQRVVGFAYPYGASADYCRPILQEAGIRYGRTVHMDPSFRFPKDPYETPMTSWHIRKNALALTERFVQEKAEEEDLFFLMFAHGYEFDFGTRESNWAKFETICQIVSAAKDVHGVSIRDAFERHEKSL